MKARPEEVFGLPEPEPEIRVSMDVHRNGTGQTVSLVIVQGSPFYGVLRTALEEAWVFDYQRREPEVLK